ncbi:MAG: YfiR family protein [Methylocystis sp.]|uniref:YfiR family protein n=1 Tax=Methylocystis sp. TaxID=1911079 RepID=UPI003DA2C7BB
MAILIRSVHMLRIACALVLASAAAPAAEPLEYAVKAAYLTKFGIYVEWPDASPGSPLNLCVAGEDPFGKALDSAAASQQPGNRPIAVKRLKTATPESGCNILFIGGADPATPQVIDSLRGSPILTVSDARDSGAIVNFVIKDNRVRFEIDETAAEQNNLVLSSKLLGLALNVKPRQQP